MIEITAELVDVILGISVVVFAARWAAQRSSRILAVAFACAVGAVYSVVSDLLIACLVRNCDHSLNAVALNALLGAPIDAAIAYVATRRRSAIVHA